MQESELLKNRMGDPRSFRGLNLLQPEVMTDEEWQRHLALDAQPSGRPLPSYEVWHTIGRPDVYKRWMNEVYHLHNSESFGFSAYLQYYLIEGWEDGFKYILQGCEKKYSKDTVIEMLAAAYLHTPTMGMYILAPAVEDALNRYRGPDNPVPWPSNWSVDPKALESGLDFSVPNLSDEEKRLLTDWYLRVTGEVPGFVRFLSEYRPQVLKAWRGRLENVIKKALPTQALAYLLLHFEALRLNQYGIKDYVLLARGLGMTKIQVIDCLTYGTAVFGGGGGFSVIDAAAGDILRSWNE